MNKPTLKQIENILKKEYCLAIGEVSLRRLQREIWGMLRKKVKISGRSYATGRKKTMVVTLADILHP